MRDSDVTLLRAISHAAVAHRLERAVGAQLLLELAALLGRDVTTEQGGIAVEVLGDFLERGVAGLDVEAVDDDELDEEPDVVDDVVLPAEGVERDGVDVAVEEEGQVDTQEHDGDALGADAVGQDLDTVADQQSRPGRVVEDVVDEDEGNLGVGGGWDGGLDELGGADGPRAERHEHTAGGEDEERATTEFVNEKAHDEGGDEVDDVQDTVDLELQLGVGDTSTGKDVRHVVRHEVVSGPLGEESERDQDEKTAAVTTSLDQLLPAVTLELLLHLDGFLDLAVLELDQLVLLVAAGVVVSENLESLLVLALGDQVTGRLRDEPDGNHLEDGRNGLTDRRDTPCPAVVDLEGAVGQPGGNDTAEVPRAVVDGGVDGTVLGVNQLGDEQRSGTVGNGDTKTDEETSGNKHLDVVTDGLENDTGDHDAATGDDTNTTAEAVGDVRSDSEGDERTDGHDGVEKTTSGRVRVVEC